MGLYVTLFRKKYTLKIPIIIINNKKPLTKFGKL